MSTAKRSRRRGAEASPPPSSKRLKSSHVPAPQSGSGLGFLVDENARAGRKLGAKLTNGVSQSKSTRVDDSRAARASTAQNLDSEDDDEDVGNNAAQEVIELSSNSESSDLESDDEEEEAQSKSLPRTNGHHAEEEEQDVAMEDEDGTGEATFGDLLQARHPQPIDVSKALQTVDSESRSLVPSSNNQLRAPLTAASLGTVLTQALKTKDKELLENCFRMNDASSIRATIQRQQSHQIATLLELIAERIHKRPGRTGKLMTWVQWSLVSHGGYLANQPELMKKLKSLGQVVRERANGLQPLLHLKGKLDLLNAQLEFRRKLQADSRAASTNEQDDEENVLYIEGQHDDWSDSDDATGATKRIKSRKPRSDKLLQIKANDDGSADEEDEDDEDAELGGPTKALGNTLDGEESSGDSEDDSDGEGMLDIEAEEGSDEDESESSNDEAPSVVSSEDDDESSDGGEIEVETVRQPKASTLNRKR